MKVAAVARGKIVAREVDREADRERISEETVN